MRRNWGRHAYCAASALSTTQEAFSHRLMLLRVNTVAGWESREVDRAQVVVHCQRRQTGKKVAVYGIESGCSWLILQGRVPKFWVLEEISQRWCWNLELSTALCIPLRYPSPAKVGASWFLHSKCVPGKVRWEGPSAQSIWRTYSVRYFVLFMDLHVLIAAGENGLEYFEDAGVDSWTVERRD